MADTLSILNYQAISFDGRSLQGVTVAVLVGNPWDSVPPVVTTQPGTVLATLFADPASVNSVTNPISTDGLGNLCTVVNGVETIGVCLAAGYYTLQLYGPGISNQLLIPVKV